MAVLPALAAVIPLSAQRLELPPRPSDAPGGSAIVSRVRTLELEAREDLVFRELSMGNVPAWLRDLRRVEMVREVDGRRSVVTFWATPDYVAVGSAADHFRMPLSPQTAQRLADLTGTSLPTPPMVDAIWAAASVRLGADSIAPTPAMTTVPVFEDHEVRVRARRGVHAEPGGALVAGHKKDVVLTARMNGLEGRVAIYGWHQPDGRPIQPVYTGHDDRWVDYSHGIRLVQRRILIDGIEHDLVGVLRDPALASLVSDEGVIEQPGYSLRPGSR